MSVDRFGVYGRALKAVMLPGLCSEPWILGEDRQIPGTHEWSKIVDMIAVAGAHGQVAVVFENGTQVCIAGAVEVWLPTKVDKA